MPTFDRPGVLRSFFSSGKASNRGGSAGMSFVTSLKIADLTLAVPSLTTVCVHPILSGFRILLTGWALSANSKNLRLSRLRQGCNGIQRSAPLK
jgi:hypothetical protein